MPRTFLEKVINDDTGNGPLHDRDYEALANNSGLEADKNPGVVDAENPRVGDTKNPGVKDAKNSRVPEAETRRSNQRLPLKRR